LGESEPALPGHDDYKALLVSYALGAVEAGELRSVEEHLAKCAECRAEIDEVRGMFSTLALSVEQVEPPAELRDRILEVVKSTPQDQVSRPKKEAKLQLAPKPARAESSENRSNEPFGRVVPFVAKQDRPSSGIKFLAIAASIGFVAALAGLYVVWNRAMQNETELAAVNTRLQEMERQLEKEREISVAFAAPNARVAQLDGTEAAPMATAKFAVNRNDGKAMLVAYNLPVSPPDKEYQLWYIADGKPLPGGVFKTDAKGHGELREVAPLEGRTATVFAITLEPVGGGQAPTSAMYLKSPAL
jgi:anti-sigma-K factor RskA